MNKIESWADVTKTFGGLGAHFKKMAEHHGLLHKHHSDHAEFLKSMHDGMADDHEHKHFFGKAHAHHAAMALVHKAIAEHNDAAAAEHDASAKVAKTEPAPVAAPTPAADGKEPKVEKTNVGDVVEGLMDKTVASVLEKALSTIASSGKIEEMVEQIVLKRLNEKLAGTTIPDKVVGVLPTLPAFDGLRLVPRPGQLEDTQVNKAEMPGSLSHWMGDVQ